jgi:hypothetical protein
MTAISDLITHPLAGGGDAALNRQWRLRHNTADLGVHVFVVYLWNLDLYAVDHHTDPEFRYYAICASPFSFFCFSGSYFILRYYAKVILHSED